LCPEKKTDKLYVQTLPEADTDSDHNLLFAKICTVLKKIIKFQNGKPDAIWKSYVLYDRKGKML
jgi:hypothetical protein